jgi:uncharacterized protein YgiM (DUF1202 family)
VSLAKVLRAALGIAIVVAVGLVVMHFWDEFKSAPVSAPATSAATPGAPSTPSTTTVTGVAVIKIDGVNFRTQPASNAKLIRGLKKDEKVTVLLKDGQWYKVKDSKGTTGWVTANGAYVVLQGQ